MTQSEKLNHYDKISFPTQNIIHINDLGSSLNYKKKGLHKLIDLILSQQINTLIINHKYGKSYHKSKKSIDLSI